MCWVMNEVVIRDFGVLRRAIVDVVTTRARSSTTMGSRSSSVTKCRAGREENEPSAAGVREKQSVEETQMVHPSLPPELAEELTA